MPKHGSILLYVHGNHNGIRLVRTDSPGRPPRLSHSSWTLWPYIMFRICFIYSRPTRWQNVEHYITLPCQHYITSPCQFSYIVFHILTTRSLAECRAFYGIVSLVSFHVYHVSYVFFFLYSRPNHWQEYWALFISAMSVFIYLSCFIYYWYILPTRSLIEYRALCILEGVFFRSKCRNKKKKKKWSRW